MLTRLGPDLQILYSPDKFDKQRTAWSLVVLFNTCRSAVAVLDVIARAETERAGQGAALLLTDTHRRLIMKLSPLREVKQTIKNRLLSQAERYALSSFVGYDEAHHELMQIEWGGLPPRDDEVVWTPTMGLDLGLGGQVPETQVNPHYSLQSLQSLQSLPEPRSTGRGSSQRGGGRRGKGVVAAVEDAIGVLRTCQEEIKALWNDAAIQAFLKAQKVRVQDIGGL
jgi:hypothetical protein